LVRYNQQIAQLGRQYQVQGIWGRNVKSILLIGLAARWLQVPLIWDIGMEKESRGLMRALHWLGLSLSTVVVTQAASQPGDIFDALAVKCFAAKFQTIAPGVGLDRILPLSCGDRPSSPQFTLLTVGTINPRKNQLLLLQAVARLSQRYPQLRVQIVGAVTDAAYFARCQDFVQAQGLEPQVEFLGWRQDVPELMQHSQLLVLSSTNEGIPYVIREAMYAALPIVATAVGGVPAAIDHGQTGFLVESSNVEQLSHWIEHCLTHPDVCAALGQRARQAAEQKFSLAEWSAQYSTLLRQLCHA
jgi:glycosyltransferase involved in cell wall biosynthesis